MYIDTHIKNIKRLLIGRISEQDEKKADLVSPDTEKFFTDLQALANTNTTISQQQRGSMFFQKSVELVQIGLILLDYELPQHGVDGLFGPETAIAINKFKKDHNVINESANQLRSKISSLGYVEKNGQLDDGGELTKEMAEIAGQIFETIKKNHPELKVRVTAGNDAWHQRRPGRSYHKTGRAIDFTINPSTPSDLNKIVNILSQFKKNNPGFWYLDEYRKPMSYSTGGHFHMHYTGGTSVINPNIDASNNPAEIASNASITPTFLNTLIQELRKIDITDEDLRGLVNLFSIEGNDNFSEIIDYITTNIEGGYYHPNMLKDGRVKDKRFSSSGETMMGIDRKNSTWNNYEEGKEFWALIDSKNASSKWPYNYMGGDVEPVLRRLVIKIMTHIYYKFANRYFSSELSEKVRNNKGLLVHFIYAAYNGEGWFRRFARLMQGHIQSGKSDEELINIAVGSRTESGNSLIRQSGKKLQNIIKSTQA